MKKTGIVTCSAACVPDEHRRKLGIVVVPLTLVIDDRCYRDGVDITPGEFYEILERGQSRISTSAPSSGDYLKAFESLKGSCESILCLTVSSGVSADFRSASTAARELRDFRVRVLDSRTAASGLGQVVLAAARVAEEGATLEKAEEKALEVVERVRVLGAIDTFEYLKRSGRVTSFLAFAAESLNIKPVFELFRGEIRHVARARSMTRALERIAREAIETYERKGSPIHLAVFHANAMHEARFLKERITGEVPCYEVLISEFTPVMGLHTGPGLVGASFY